VALIGVALLILAGSRRVGELMRYRRTQVAMAGIVLACAAQAAWIVSSTALELYGNGPRVPLSEKVRTSVGLIDERLRQMVGWFGWLDTPPPLAVHLAWALALLVLLAVALRRAAPRSVGLTVLLAVAVVAVPVVLEARSVSDVGYFWQGRYTLPLAVGVPLVAAWSSRLPAGRRVPAALIAVVAVCHLVSYVVTLGRYTVGTGQGLGLVDGDWAPPLPALTLVLAFSLTLLVGGIGLARLIGRPVQTPDGSGAGHGETVKAFSTPGANGTPA
jgi:hypothetical protein